MRLATRDEWGARPRHGFSAAPEMSRGVAVHWLGDSGAPADHGECAATMRWVQNQHMDTDQLVFGGASDFAYNAGACPHGVVFEGRGPRVRNAANGGGARAGADANAGWAAVLYFDAANGPGLTPEGRDAINDAAAWLGVAGGEWLGHRDFLSTACPGEEITAWVRAGHPRGAAPVPPPPPERGLSMLTFRYIFDGLDWVFDGPSKLFFQLDDTDQITQVLDPLGVVALGEVSPAVHRRYSAVAEAAGFSG